MIFQNCLKFHEPFTTYNNFEICLSLRITISKYHSRYLCQTSLQIMLLPIQTSISVNFYPTMATDVHELGIHVQFLCDALTVLVLIDRCCLYENQCFRSLILRRDRSWWAIFAVITISYANISRYPTHY